MYEFDTKIKINVETILSPNLAGKFSESDLAHIGNKVFRGFEKDKSSRASWERRMQAAADLALQVMKEKNFPWPGCSNIKFPLVTIAALQFHSRSYPALVQGNKLVKCRVIGTDPSGEQKERALRISNHMSWQLMEEDESWEEQHDRALFVMPIMGCIFKKIYHSGRLGHNVSEMVMPTDLVMDYYAKSVEGCARKTQVIPMYRNEIYENVMTDCFVDVLEEPWFRTDAKPYRTPEEAKEDLRKGIAPTQTDEDTPFTLLEQHCWFDFDHDGYAEPYIVTIEATTKKVLRIVARVEREEDVIRNSKGDIVRIVATEYFEKYGLIPAPDGGVYDLGFGVLLGPLNESVNSILNQLVDAGTMATAAGGFLARGAKLRSGQYTFAPLEWKRVDATGDDLRKSIFPLPVREPSPVLFQLLSLLINFSGRISGTTDTMVGENPGQNTPAANMQAMVEQGMKIYNTIFKRVWRSTKKEFKKLYILNSIYMPDTKAFGPDDQKAYREDYIGDPDRIVPEADPNISSDAERMRQAIAVKQAAASTPGYDIAEVERNFLRAMQVDGWELLYPGPDKIPSPPNPRVQVEEMKLQAKQQALQMEKAQFIINIAEQKRLNTAKIMQLEAQAAKLVAEAKGVDINHQLSALNVAIGAMRDHNDGLARQAELMLKAMETTGESTNRAGVEGMAGPSGNPGTEKVPEGVNGQDQGGMGGGSLY